MAPRRLRSIWVERIWVCQTVWRTYGLYLGARPCLWYVTTFRVTFQSVTHHVRTHVRTYVLCENRSRIQSLALMRSAIKWACIIELADSDICRDSADTQYMIIQKRITQNLKNSKLYAFITMCHPSSSVFMTNDMPTGAKKHHESTKPPSRQMAMFFFFRWASSKLRDSFTMVFAQTSSISHWAVHQPIAFSLLWSHSRWFKVVTEELWLH